jgi:hypothetical protein
MSQELNAHVANVLAMHTSMPASNVVGLNWQEELKAKAPPGK